MRHSAQEDLRNLKGKLDGRARAKAQLWVRYGARTIAIARGMDDVLRLRQVETRTAQPAAAVSARVEELALNHAFQRRRQLRWQQTRSARNSERSGTGKSQLYLVVFLGWIWSAGVGDWRWNFGGTGTSGRMEGENDGRAAATEAAAGDRSPRNQRIGNLSRGENYRGLISDRTRIHELFGGQQDPT